MEKPSKKPSESSKKPSGNKKLPRLNNRQQIFVQEYMVDLNARRAAIAAGYSEKSAGAIGNENLLKPKIKAAVEAEMERRRNDNTKTAEDVIKELAEIAFVKTPDFTTVPPSKVKALELLSRHFGLLHDKQEIDIKQPVQITVKKFCSRKKP